MAASQAQLITFNSITVLGVNSTIAVDRTQPLSFIQWIPYNKATYTTPENALRQYQIYLTNWYSIQGASTEETANAIQYLYANLINEIVINYSTIDEQRYLSNLDFNNSRDLAIAIPFFSKKIKDVCLYYVTLRETAQTATTQYNLKGSNIGIKTLLYNTISNALQSQDLTNTINTLNLSISSIRNNMVLDIESIYDLTPDYYDISPSQPVSAYNPYNDTRGTYFAANQVNIDPFLTLDYNQSIVNAILKYPIFTSQLGTQLAINPAILPTQLNLLKDSDYINNVNTGDPGDLTLNTQIIEQEKYIGADFYYIITDSTLTTFTSGQLFAARSEFANVLNKRYPTIAAIPSEAFLKTSKEMGLFFKPDKIGLLHFTNFNFTASVDLKKLQPGTVYYFPDPAKYGNVTSNTQQTFVTPLDFFENNYFNKVDFSNQYRFGDVDSKPYYQLFRSYQSREQTLDYSDTGISRYTDYQDFFTGGLDDIWSNIDAYPLTPTELYPIDQRAGNLLTINSTLFNFKSDIYGNQYGLYKPTTTTKAPLSSPVIPEASITDLVLDSNYFIYTKPLSIDNTLNGGTFIGTPPTVLINSYRFNFEAFTPDYVSSNFNISIADCETFISPANTGWTDSPSDIITYNPTKYGIYYNTLIECGTTNTGIPAISGYLPTFLHPTSGFAVYDGYWFTVDYYDNELNITTNYDPLTQQQYTFAYTEPTNLVDIRVPGLDSTLDFSLTGSNNINYSLYETRNTVTGTIYCRTPDSTIVAPFSSALSGVYTKYTSLSAPGTTFNIGYEINNLCISLDVIYDVLQVETYNYLIFDKIRFNYTDNTVPGSIVYSYLFRGYYPQYESFSNTWFNESTNQLIVCQTKLYTSLVNGVDPLSATNYKIIYPKIYTIDLNAPQPLQLFPHTSDQNLALSSISQYSLSGTNILIDIVTVEKPVLSFNGLTNIYDLTYLCKDTANTFYTVNTKFKYINGVLTIVSNTIYTPSANNLHQNYGTYGLSSTFVLPSLTSYSILGTPIGSINTTDSTFTFNNITYSQYLEYQDSITSPLTSDLLQQNNYEIAI